MMFISWMPLSIENESRNLPFKFGSLKFNLNSFHDRVSKFQAEG